MKKKILFIISNLNIGGFQKSLINLLSEFDYNKYQVDLFVIENDNLFIEQVPSNVNILNAYEYSCFFRSFYESVKILWENKNLCLLLYRYICAFFSLFNKGLTAFLMSKILPKLDNEYDVAIDYNGQYLLYYLIDKIEAKKKLTFFHSDYSKWNYYYLIDKLYYPKTDAIITVSDLCANSLKEYFPDCKKKIYVVENIISQKTVNLFPSNHHVYDDKFTGNRFVTVGRVCEDKGILLALHSAKLLKEQGYDFKWYFVGPVDDIQRYSNIIENLKISGHILFVGPTNNPYDYIRGANIVIHPSKFEGKAVTVEEAKIMNKLIICTNYSTVKDQIEDEKTGLIVEMNEKSLCDGIIRLLNDKNLRNNILENQKRKCKGNTDEIDKLYKLF